MARKTKEEEHADLYAELERVKRELQKTKESEQQLKKSLTPPPKEKVMEVTKPLISLTAAEKRSLLSDDKLRTILVDLFRLTPRKNRHRKQEILELKQKAFNRYKKWIINEYKKQGKNYTDWGISGISNMSGDWNNISTVDSVIMVASHPAYLRDVDSTEYYAYTNSIPFRIKANIKATDLVELLDEIVPIKK